MNRIIYLFVLSFTFLVFCSSKKHCKPADSGKTSQINEDKGLLLQNVTLIDVKGKQIIGHQDIFINDGIIRKIDEFNPKIKCGDVKTINLSGMYAIPGLIEAHNHVSGDKESSLTQALHWGVTTIRDMGGDGEYLADLQQRIYEEELEVPDVYFSAVMGGSNFILQDARARLSTPIRYKLGEAPWVRCVEENSNIQKIVTEAKNCGASGLKLYADLSKETIKELVAEAHKQGLKVWGHAFVGPANVLDVVESDVDVISHIPALLYKKDWELKRDGSLAVSEENFDTDYFKSIIEVLKEKQIIVDATLSVFCALNKGDNERMKTVFELTKLVFDEGIPIVTGTDNSLIIRNKGCPNLLKEIEMFVDSVGLPPIEVLKCATLNGAKAIGIEKTHGSIELGKVANIVILRDNPLDDIRNIEKVNCVIKNGKIIKKEDL